MKIGLMSLAMGLLLTVSIACGSLLAIEAETDISPSTQTTPAAVATLEPDASPEPGETLSSRPPLTTTTTTTLTTATAALQSAPAATPIPTPEDSEAQPNRTESQYSTPRQASEPPPEPMPEISLIPAVDNTPEPTAEPTSEPTLEPTPTATPEPDAGLQMREALSVDFVDMAWFSNSASKRVFGERTVGERLLFEFKYRNNGEREISSFFGVVTFDDLYETQIKTIPLTYDSTLTPLQEATATYNLDPADLIQADQWLVNLCGPDFPPTGLILTCRKSDMTVAFEPNSILFTDGTSLQIKGQ